MSMTLNLADRLLAMGRNLQALGRDRDALHVLGRLSGFRQLPTAVSEEAQLRQAEILLQSGRYVRARRHLTALLVQQPDSARYHYLMAIALNGDVKADPQRAAEHYRQSLQLDPDQPDCLGAFGLLALRLGQTEEGLSHLRKAVELAPSDPEVVGRLAEGLREEGRLDEARSVLRAALFRNPRDARFRTRWDEFQFRQLSDEQYEAQAHLIPIGTRKAPWLLPFVRPTEAPEAGKGVKLVRQDGPSALPPPRAPRPGPLPGKKHA
jgi:tetratricopeptide (TPR) repeat protein